MNKPEFVAVACLLGMIAVSVEAAANTSPHTDGATGYVTGQGLPEFKPDPGHAKRMAWWQDARYGMFICWGGYAQFEGTYKGKRIREGCFAMREHKIPLDEYKQTIRAFNPQQFDADALIRFAKSVGMRYVVFTAKHAEGLAMWHSKSSTFNVKQATDFNRDPLMELSKACKKHGIGLGVYYSLGWDWADSNATTGPFNDWTFDPKKADPQKYFDLKVYPQVEEIASQYEPDLMWFDVPGRSGPWAQKLIDVVRKHRPDCIVNNRLPQMRGHALDSYGGDYDTPETYVPVYQPPRIFEVCQTINGPWGWAGESKRRVDARKNLSELIACVSKGGNYLLNISPDSKGVVCPPHRDTLATIGKWMAVNGDAIHSAGRSLLPKPAWGRITAKPGKVFLHIDKWPEGGRLFLGGLKNKIKAAYALTADGNRALPSERITADDVAIRVGKTPWAELFSVVCVEVDDAFSINQVQALDPWADYSELHTVDCQPGGDVHIDLSHKEWRWKVTRWNEAGESISWPRFRVVQPGTYGLSLQYGAPVEAAGSTMDVVVGGQTIRHAITASDQGKNGIIHDHALADVELSAGVHTLTLTARSFSPDTDNLCNLRSVRLTRRPNPSP